ncbi:MAG: ACP S-malonyltransferase [Lachnospiraceae bacterium]|nr:ACP S-malonyltransferase [Lachnospiraceae bacterium]MBP3506222.1 ACP S-malonyltransferase [Lachnospiraceae bacterium]
MKLAFMYAGQGSQSVGMGKDFYEAYPEFRQVMDNTNVGFDVKDCCFNGPAEMLNTTKYTQPCMVAFAVGVTKVLKSKGIVPEMAAGLSLGEYSALHAAGVFEDQQVISLVAFRGQAMAEAVVDRECKMAAVLNLDRSVVQDCCAKAHEEFKDQTFNVVEPTNYNCPGQIVISGDKEPVDRAIELLMEAGARRCLPLNVSGPFHTSLMKPAGDRLKARFAEETFGKMQLPVVFNTIGRAKTEEETIPALLEKQVQSSIYVEDSIRYMAEQGIDTIVEIGPGSALSKFVKKTCPEITCYSVEKVEDVDALVEALA